MPITVRTPKGELTFESVDSVWRAVKAGDVAPIDDVRTAPTEPWQKIKDLPRRKRSLWERLNPWVVLMDAMGAKRS